MYRRLALLFLFLLVPATAVLAGAGFWNTLFGSGDQEFVCYTRVHRNFYLAVFISVVVLALFIFRIYRLRAKHATRLEEQNRIIEEQNHDIVSSIRYAGRIQTALLPTAAKINSLLPDSFFWLRPKDIVSGDFYWLEAAQGKIFIAAIDCTGHGVPGAFLSFIGHNAFHRAISEKGLTDPAQILNDVNMDVRRTLGQEREENEINDGMEVALCVWDPASRQLSYAGAGRPLYLLRDKQLEEIRGAKFSIGSMLNVDAAPISGYQFTLDKGDAFYIGSDGIADQFGGPQGKKFKTAQLKELIVKTADRPMAEQGKTISAALTDWSGKHAQTDDMLLIGVRV